MPVRLFVWPPAEGAEIPKDYVGVTIESWENNGVHVGLSPSEYRTACGNSF